jgi:hypothetical protein
MAPFMEATRLRCGAALAANISIAWIEMIVGARQRSAVRGDQERGVKQQRGADALRIMPAQRR